MPTSANIGNRPSGELLLRGESRYFDAAYCGFLQRPTRDHNSAVAWSALGEQPNSRHTRDWKRASCETVLLNFTEPPMPHITVGDRAPQFTATAHTGQQVALADYLGKQDVVLYFYPRDGTPSHRRGLPDARRPYADCVAAGAVVIGVTSTRSSGTANSPERDGYRSCWLATRTKPWQSGWSATTARLPAGSNDLRDRQAGRGPPHLHVALLGRSTHRRSPAGGPRTPR